MQWQLVYVINLVGCSGASLSDCDVDAGADAMVNVSLYIMRQQIIRVHVCLQMQGKEWGVGLTHEANTETLNNVIPNAILTYMIVYSYYVEMSRRL